MDRIEIAKTSNKIWHIQKLVGDNPDLNYYGIDISDSGLDPLDDDEPDKDRVLIVWVHTTTFEIEVEYMGAKTDTQNYVKGDLMTNTANKKALRSKILDLFNTPAYNQGYVIVSGSLDDE